MAEESADKLIEKVARLKSKLILKSIAVGIFSSLMVILYRIMLTKADSIREYALHMYNSNHLYIFLILFLVVINSLIIKKFVKTEPMISGSGIPQIKGVILRQIDYNPIKAIYKKLIGGFLAILNGLSLGREGPSVQIGATVGMYFSRKLELTKMEEKYLITAGASAGLAAAFNAPLAAVIFSLEELHKNFSPMVLLTSMIAAIVSDFISKTVFGLKPVFNFQLSSTIPLKYYPFLILLGFVTGILGVYFNKSLLKSTQVFKKIENRILISSLIGVVLLLTIPDVLGGGHDLVIKTSKVNITLKQILIILVIKFAFTMISYASSAPGGIFLPMLALGALIGKAFYSGIFIFFDTNNTYMVNFITLGMVGYFVTIVRAPITGIVLITEMVGTLNHFLELSLVSFVSYITAELLNEEPIYESLLERILESSGGLRNLIRPHQKTLIEITISTGSELDGIKIKNFKWPEGCLIVSIRRGNKEIIPNGEVVLHAGDILSILTTEESASKNKRELIKKATSVKE
ncbi:ClC family H(+)/Cl(-) exchange transporter [Fervidobacterium sp. 2310opik-2]|uniref:ClC family H(+)/Cl(-) exchange transporter n=1 Tax=Fervidobacterium sp. 2310opik-2 TaxID=1755815 RepID=UPI0013DE87F9|nr:ClC family H(+)/Cl(-) exchange transporter [Fervidobacterium sp. 2310opik-2]KAF2961710.1 ClC family H(+)/Cl(-) exchange transporter [Fervidobacterium sp. 2310opik-2]